MNIAIIPARGGSKRIHRKNISQFAGKPIIAWSIEAALRSKIFDKVIVSTDDKEIAEVAQKYGAEVPFLRPDNLSDDYTSTIAVIIHALNWMRNEGFKVEFICCIYATAPLIQEFDLISAYEKLVNSKKSFVFTVTQYPHPVQRAIELNTDGEVTPISPEYKDSRSQDLKKTYHDAGQFYWGRSQAFLEKREIFSSDSLAQILPPHLVCDIDEPSDLLRAELLFQNLIDSGKISK